YWSKDAILEAAWNAGTGVGQFAYWLGIVGAWMTAFYSFRLLIVAFHGKPRADEHVMAHVHESPAVMTIPLLILAIGAPIAGASGYHWFVGDGVGRFWGKAILVLQNHAHAGAEMPFVIEWLPLAAGVLGILVAIFMYGMRPELPGMLARTFRPIYLF